MRIFKVHFKFKGRKTELLLNFVPMLWRIRFYRNRTFIDGGKMINMMLLGVQFRIMVDRLSVKKIKRK